MAEHENRAGGTIVSRVTVIVVLFVAIILSTLFVARFQMRLSGAVRAYVGGEGLWAKAQKDALRSLERYIVSHDEADYQAYLSSIQVTLGDRQARLELQKPDPDMQVVRDGFLRGRNHPDDVEPLAWFFRRFQHTSTMSRAIQHWVRGDLLIGQLQKTAGELHETISTGGIGPAELRAFRDRLDGLNGELANEEDDFSAVLSEGARRITSATRTVTLIIGLVFTTLGVALSLPIIIRIRTAEGKIRKLNEELELKVRERTRELLETREKLVRKQKMVFLGRLAGNVSHELRNPLGVINNAIYFLKMTMPDANEAAQDNMNIIKAEVDNSMRVISDLLDFASAKPPRMKQTTVGSLIGRSLQKLTVPENVRLLVDIAETLPPVSADPFQMKKVLQNLIMNAVQAMPGGGVLRIGAQPVESEGRETGNGGAWSSVKISIADTGEGIAPANMEKLFDPLFTTRARGIGLGLTVAKQLIEAQGGRIEVKSAVGKGTTVTVVLAASMDAALLTS